MTSGEMMAAQLPYLEEIGDIGTKIFELYGKYMHPDQLRLDLIEWRKRLDVLKHKDIGNQPAFEKNAKWLILRGKELLSEFKKYNN